MDDSMKQTNLELDTNLPEESEMHPTGNESVSTSSEKSAPELETILAEASSQIEQTKLELEARLPKESERQPTVYESVSTSSEQSAPAEDSSTQIKQNAEQVTEIEAPLPSHSKKQPIDRLLDAVRAASPSTLISACKDMKRVIDEADFIVVDDDPMPELPVGVQQDCTTNRVLKREFEVVSRDVSQSQAMFDSAAKKSRTQSKRSNCELLAEVQKMNTRLMETVIKVSMCDKSNRTIVTCTYTPVTVAEDFKKKIAPIIAAASVSVDLLVPSDYPSSPPTVSYRSSEGLSEMEHHFMKETISGFETRLAGSTPLRVGNMAQAWNDSARSSFQEFAKSLGAHTFSSCYGSWETVSRD